MAVPFIPIVVVICLLVIIFRFIQNYRQVKKLKSLYIMSQIQLLKEIDHQQTLKNELLSLKEKFDHEVLCDSLTALPGRKIFEDRLLQTLNQSRRYQLTFGVLFLDLDGFKVINEALGHDIGDELLKEVAIRLKNSIRQVDSVSRFAGDKFVLMLSQLSKPESAVYVAQRLLDVLSQPFKIRDQDLFITASIGIATYPADGDDPKVLLKNADNALHRAKASGRNGYKFFHEEMSILSQRELVLSSSLQRPEVEQSFFVMYQPQINMSNNKITSMQALLFWQHPDFGVMALSEFSDIAENNGKIIQIGKWLLLNAMQQFQKWQKLQFCPNTISVNVSTKQLENSSFTYKLSQMLQELQIDPSHLVLEIPEVVLLPKLETIEKSFHMLKHLGVQIGIKDFGGSQLSLQHLKRFPVDYLKISPSLIQDITINKNSEMIVKMIVVLAKSLQINVIADGVESYNQKQLLIELGCVNMQGTFFSPPFSPEEFTEAKVNALTIVR